MLSLSSNFFKFLISKTRIARSKVKCTFLNLKYIATLLSKKTVTFNICISNVYTFILPCLPTFGVNTTFKVYQSDEYKMVQLTAFNLHFLYY